MTLAAPNSRSTASPAPAIVTRGTCLVIAITCVAAGLAIASAYPFWPFVVTAAFVAWVAFATIRFEWAWPTLIALVPAIAFSTWTGWLAFEEVDLLVLATAAGGYASWVIGVAEPRAHRSRSAPSLSLVSWPLVLLFFGSTAIALVRGIDAAGGLQFDRFDWAADYNSAQNSVRIFKSFAFALLTLPLLAREWRKPGGLDRFGTGMTVALGLCGVLIVQERLAFTGLLSFSEDYRVTGPFWEMQTGGAALDGFLALTIPFAAREALRHPDRVRFVGAMGVLALAAYAALVTFSRGVYAAVPLSLVSVFLLMANQRSKVDRRAAWASILKIIVFAVVVAVCGGIVFRHGGYRATLAVFLTLVLAIPVDAALRRSNGVALLKASALAVLLVVIGWAAATLLPKGPYVIYGAALLATSAAVLQAGRDPRPRFATLAVASWLWLATSAVAVASYWGGSVALHDSAIVVAGLAVLVAAASRLPRAIWPSSRRDRFITVGIAGVVLATMTVFAAGAYMTSRFSTSGGDFQYRIKHWRNGIGRLAGMDWVLGKGLGRFPATSVFEPADSGGQGGDRLVTDEHGESYVQLTAPHVRYLGFFELFRMSQRVAVRPDTSYVATVVARFDNGSALHVEVCARHLLYVDSCQVAEMSAQVDATQGSGWHTYRYAFNSGNLGRATWWAPRPSVLSLATGSSVDVSDVRLYGPDGVDLVANGNFRDHRTHWFVTSDRFHLPWHIKNMALDVLFDQGILGLTMFLLVVGGALLRTAAGRAHLHPDAPFVAAAIVGYGIVGAFDSLLDVPRVAFLFYLVVMLGLMLRNPRMSGPTRSMVRTPAAPAPVVAQIVEPVTIDAAAERARRRQQAFGSRKRVDSRSPE